MPGLDNSFSEEIFLSIQSNPPLAPHEAVSCCPITQHFIQWKGPCEPVSGENQGLMEAPDTAPVVLGNILAWDN